MTRSARTDGYLTEVPKQEEHQQAIVFFLFTPRVLAFCFVSMGYQKVPSPGYISLTSTYAKVTGRVSMSLHILNLSMNFLHVTPLPLGVVERNDLIAGWRIIQ